MEFYSVPLQLTPMRIAQEPHPVEETVERYAAGLLPEEQAFEIERHLLLCDACRDRVAAADTYVPAMKTAARRLPPEKVKKPFRWGFRVYIPAFAMAALALAAVVFLPHARVDRPPVDVALFAMRGAAGAAEAPSRTPLRLEPDLTGLEESPSYRLEIVDSSGHPVWNGAFAPQPAPSAVLIPSQRQGTYFVRVSLPSGRQLREYALRLRGQD